MKKVASLALFLALVMGVAAHAAEFNLTIAHIVDEGNSWHKASAFFKEEVEKRSGGRIAVTIYPNSQLGSEIDQMLGQWHADLLGLGDLFDPVSRRRALRHMMEHNFKPRIGDVANLWRNFAVDGEAGTVICDYTGARRPAIPIPYSEECMTGEAKEALYASDTLIGASSVVDSVTEQIGEKGKFVKKYKEFLPDKVAEVLKNDPDIKRAAIVMRGDVGFYSGAKKVINALEQMQQYDITLIPGISSVVCFAARLGVSWEDARLISLHGKHGNLIQAVLTSKKTFVLTGGENSVGSLCGKLCEYGLGDLEVAVGECLSYPEERIIRKKAVELSGDFDTLSILYIENPAAVQKLRVGLPDEMFIRRDVPMTKSEIRAVSLSKLALQSDSVIYDIGAGTGSVSVECALNAPEGCVFAVEKNASAVDLVRENKVKFGLENLIVIPGTAPEALEDLPVPTHAFIGGSSGNLKEIITSILEKTEKTRIVVNAVTLETLSEAVSCRKIFNFEIFDVVTLNVSCSQKLGNYNMMKAHNPVSVITMQKRKDDGK